MGTIQSTIGLITGIDIQSLVNSLIEISSRPKTLLEQRNETFQQQQTALGTLAGMIYSLKLAVSNLGKSETYQERQVTSSAADVLAATKTGTPPLGSFQFTPIRMSQNHQLFSSGFRSADEALGQAGTLTIRFGDHVERSLSLSLLNEGAGMQRGKMRIVDRSGAWADIDLSTAQSIDDVLNAINNNSTVNVVASVRDGRIRLEDQTGQTVSNLKVLEVGGGTTAQSLGLAGIDLPSNMAEGQDILGLFDDFDLNLLNDGAGIRISTGLPEISYTLRDGSSGSINFASSGTREVTLGQILQEIETQSDGKIQAEIASDGRRLVLTDQTTGTGTFRLTSLYESPALADLGLDTEAVDGVITGRRILSGLRTVSLSNLNGGSGLGALGLLQLTDRSGASDTVDLSSAETLEDVIEAINNASVSVLARVNSARNGIELIDTSGSTTSNLIVANGDETNTADKLQIAINAPVSSVNSGDLHLRILSENSLLSSLNGGAGVAKSIFYITDSRGVTATIDLRSSSIQTLGDVIQKINSSAANVRAECNATGDGILIRDMAGGTGTLTVTEGGSTTARDLGLLRSAKTLDEEGQTYQVIDGSMTYEIELSDTESLQNLKDKINALGAGFSASLLQDGSAWPWHLALTSQRSGKVGALVVDASQLQMAFQETTQAQDALLLMGPASSAASGMVVTSSSNTFTNALEGASLEIKQASGTTVNVQVNTSNATLLASIQTLVENYNKYRDQLEEYTQYDTEAGTGAILTGDNTTLRFDTDLTGLLSGEFTTGSRFTSVAQLGIALTEEGKLSFDATKFQAAYAEDPEGVEEFFATSDTGFANRMQNLIEQLAGADSSSLISARLQALEDKIDYNEQRIEYMTTMLEKERTRLLTQFYNMEVAVAKIQSSLSTLDSISWITQQNKSSQ